ncbi:methylmalonyl-CoA mutase family protein [Myroides sp. DF42-4-2]|uniref:methylmalonyl-CoA mutase family protein n=1 Tax=unclassified Myroides TaxID=2642485 RepID=UPI002578103B|nr:methylmalonyl-CoA mutase family protein [Myroides sp. DF42-4-2]MDM1407768.1 methylmalonyl-CoA mutase [Myroides sp. DF42-4-2]
MNHLLFEEFNSIPAKQWKNKIQYELHGADYNETLVWESLEGIKVRPFYHRDESQTIPVSTQNSQWQIVQAIYIQEIDKSILNAKTSLQKGTEVLYFTLVNPTLDVTQLLGALPKDKTYLLRCLFLDHAYIENLAHWAREQQYTLHLLTDPIHQLITSGNWFHNLNTDFNILNALTQQYSNVNLTIDTKAYQQAGATIVQQIAYACTHFNEYLSRVKTVQQPIFIEVSVGSNYFFEIAKHKVLRLLFDLIASEYNYTDLTVRIISTPTKRNKTLYGATVNALRTTTECMSAVLGGADFVCNLPYDALYRKENYASQQIARNQLLSLKKHSHFHAVDNPTEGAYYIEELTKQLAEKALDIIKQIEQADGLITSFHQGTIQRKIAESDQKEQDWFHAQREILVGTNLQANPNEKIQEQLELFPFVKQKPRKTLLAPLIEKRLAESYEQHRLTEENN